MTPRTNPSPRIDTPGSRVIHARRANPITSALEAYHRDHGAYPISLVDLRPGFLRTGVSFQELIGAPSSWLLRYDRLDADDYELKVYGPHTVALYQNGALVAVYGSSLK
jgi:hypothetical protein